MNLYAPITIPFESSPLEDLFPESLDAPSEQSVSVTNEVTQYSVMGELPLATTAHRLRKYRREKKLTQIALGKRSGISHKVISSIELGTSKASDVAITKLAAALEIDRQALDDQPSIKRKQSTSPWFDEQKKYRSSKINKMLKEVLQSNIIDRQTLAKLSGLCEKTLMNLQNDKNTPNHITTAKLGPILTYLLHTPLDMTAN